MLAKRSNTAFCCQEYSDSLTHDKCEVSYLLNQDEEAREWINRGQFLKRFEIHHIYGRSNKPESNYWCNLIRLSAAAHNFGHDRFPYGLEVSCWLAKFEKHQSVFEWLDMTNRQYPSTENYDWHEDTLNRVVVPFVSIRGRVEFLVDKCAGTTFERHGKRLLELMDK